MFYLFMWLVTIGTMIFVYLNEAWKYLKKKRISKSVKK